MAVDQQQEFLLHSFHIKVLGANLPAAMMQRVAEISVEQSVHLPDMCILRFHDSGDPSDPTHHALFRLVDGNTLTIGNDLEIQMGYGQSPATVFKGEISAVELDATATAAPVLSVRGYARSHRLHRGRYRRSFLNVTDSDIARQLASEKGLSATTDATPVVHDYVFQNNQTSWEFLKERAARNGYEVFVDDRTLYFRKPKIGDSPVATEELGKTLLNVRVKMSSSFQAKQVTVQAWDSKTKQAIVGQASSSSFHPSIGLGKSGAQASQTFGDASVYVVSDPVASQSEANALAQAIYDELDGSFIQAEATSLGNPAIKPGKVVELRGLGTKLSGKYYVTAATHTISGDHGYVTSYAVSGRQANTILDLTQPISRTIAPPNVVIGIVTNNTDPDGLGRVKVKFPWLVDNDESWWARIASPMAGPNRGFMFLPEVNDEVLVAFEHGDMTRPYVLGVLWNGTDPPPKQNSAVVGSSKVNERLIKTRAGHLISLDDTENAEKVTIKTKSGHELTLDDSNGKEQIQIKDKTGNNLVKIESPSNTITIQSNGDVTVQAQKNVSVSSQTGNISVEAQTGNVTVKTASGNVEVSTQAGNLDLKGLQVNVEAQTNLSLKGNMQVQIQGAMVQIN